jgi:hypothetical protein
MADPDFLQVVVGKRDVIAADTRSTTGILRSLVSSPAVAGRWLERVDVAFEGYDESASELWEIEEVRSFAQHLDDQFPYWLFFLSKDGLGLQCIALCLLPPFLSAKGKSEVLPIRLKQLLENRWFPAMNELCEFAGIPHRDIEAMTDRAIRYFWRL